MGELTFDKEIINQEERLYTEEIEDLILEHHENYEIVERKLRWIKEYELFPHTGCFLCPYQTKKAWLILKTHYPELFKIALKYHHDNLRLVGIPIIPDGIEEQKPLRVAI